MTKTERNRLPFKRALLLAAICPLLFAAAAQPAKNFFANPSFELGRDGWQLDKAGKTEARFSVDEKDPADGQHSALLTLGSIEGWGVQFGQSFPSGEKGKTYTFAVFAKSTKGPVEAWLQIERPAKPWDRAVGEKLKLTEQWQEFHVTFMPGKEFREGWFAYLSCNQRGAELRVDMFRLYEGPYAPHEQIAQQETAANGVRFFDTGKTSFTPLTSEAISSRASWTEVTEDKATHGFEGDAVLVNQRLAVVLRRGARGAEVYSLGPEKTALRAALAPLAGTNASALASFTIVENGPALGIADATFSTPDGQTLKLRYELKIGQPFVQTEARGGATSLCVEAPSRFVVMPDFFADDIVIDAAGLPVSTAELPSDNFLLHLLPGGEAMVMTVAKTSEEDIRVLLTGTGEERRIDSSEVRYGKDGKIWVAVLAAPAIWHSENITRKQAGQITRLDWNAPFQAQWRVDWRRAEDLTDSWEMISERPDGRFARPSVFGEPEVIPSSRDRWTTVLGEFKYPAWVDKSGQGYLQPLKTSALRFEGPAIIYPVNRAPATALDTFTMVDIVRNTLGVGPCEYILDIEGQQSKYKGRATCSVRDTLNPIYAARQQLQRKAEIEKVLQDLMIFIRHIRGRIETYVAFGHETLGYLAEQKQVHPELAERLAELEVLARGIDAKVAARKNEIKTPDAVAEMVADFRNTVLEYQGDDALAQCKRFTEGWVDVGGNQDELVGECRWEIKMIRQRAGLMMAVDPRVAEVAKEIRRRSQLVLRNPAVHEGARH